MLVVLLSRIWVSGIDLFALTLADVLVDLLTGPLCVTCLAWHNKLNMSLLIRVRRPSHMSFW